jgi:hypothetical protein
MSQTLCVGSQKCVMTSVNATTYQDKVVVPEVLLQHTKVKVVGFKFQDKKT